MSSAYSGFIDRARHPERAHHKMAFVERDARILEHVHYYGGVLKAVHLLDLEFPNTSGKACQRRLTQLFHNGYLLRTSKVGSVHCGGTVYWLTKQGAREVAASAADQRSLSSFVVSPVWSQIRHDLRIVDLVLAIQRACAQSRGEFKVHEWLTERDLRTEALSVQYVTRAGATATRKVVPDAYLQIDRHTGKGEPFHSRLLLEVDNSTHPHRRFADYKVLPGIEWVKSAGYKKRFGAPRGRWLVVTKSEQRLTYLKETIERVAGKAAAVWYFTTFEQVSDQTILTAPIWQRGGGTTPTALFPPRDR